MLPNFFHSRPLRCLPTFSAKQKTFLFFFFLSTRLLCFGEILRKRRVRTFICICIPFSFRFSTAGARAPRGASLITASVTVIACLVHTESPALPAAFCDKFSGLYGHSAHSAGRLLFRFLTTIYPSISTLRCMRQGNTFISKTHSRT